MFTFSSTEDWMVESGMIPLQASFQSLSLLEGRVRVVLSEQENWFLEDEVSR